MKNFFVNMAVKTALLSALALLRAVPALAAPTTGFNQTGAGPYDYSATSNWVGGTINGIWDYSLSLGAEQTVTFDVDTNIATGLTFTNAGSYGLILKGTGGNRTITLGGDIYASPAGNSAAQVTLGGAEGSKLNIDLGGATRTVYVHYVYSSAYDTLCITNIVSNGGMNKTGSGYLRLYGDNTFADGLTLNAGHLSLGHNNAAGTGTLTINGGRIYGYGPDSSYTNSCAVSLAGDFEFGKSSSLPLILSGAVTLNASTVTIIRIQNSSADMITGAIGDGGNSRVLYIQLSKNDNGADFYLSGNNTFGGGLKVESSNSGGGGMRLFLDHDNAAGTGTITLFSGRLNTSTGTRNIANQIDIQGHATYKPSLACAGTALNLNGNLRIVGANGQFYSYSTGVTLNGDIEDDGSDRDLTMDQSSGTSDSLTFAGSLAMQPGSRFLVVGLSTYTDKLTVSGSGKTHTGQLVASTSSQIDLTGSNNTFNDKVSVSDGTMTLTGSDNAFAGGLELNGGLLKIANASAIAGGTLTINGGFVTSDSSTDRTITTPVVFAGSCTLGTNASGTGSLTFSGANTLTNFAVLRLNPGSGETVTLSSLSGTGGFAKTGTNTLVLASCEMTYQGPTEVWEGILQVPAAGILGSNLAVRVYGGTLEANASGNFRSGQEVYLAPASTNAVMPVLSLKYNGIPSLDSSSQHGVIAVDTTDYGSVTNLSTLGDGTLWLGSTVGGTVTNADLQPGTNNTWRLGGGGGGTLVLDASSGAALTNSADLVVGRNGNGLNFTNTVALKDANTFDGDITVNSGSKLTGWMQTSGSDSPFGLNSASNPVTLNGGTLELTTNGSATATIPVSVGALTFTGGSGIYLKGTGGAAANAKANLTLHSVTRDPTYRSGLIIYGQNNSLGTNELLYVTNPGSELALDSCNMLKPYYVIRTSSTSESFVTNGTDGLKPRGFNKTTIASSTATDLVNLTANETMDSDTTIHALRLYYGPTLSGSGKLTINSGGIISSSAQANFFQTISCVVTSGMELVFSSFGSELRMSGDIQGENGLTKLGPNLLSLSTNAVTPTNSFTGTITIAQGGLSVQEDRCLGTTNNMLVLNGGGLYLNAVSPQFYREIRIGPNGGYINNTHSSWAQTFNGPITGPGLLCKGGAGKGITIASSGNTWSGGFLMTAGPTTVYGNSSLGAGDVTVTGGTLNLCGHANIASTATLAMPGYATVNMQENNSTYTIGALSGAGSLVLNTNGSSGTVTLDVGGNNASTEFGGVISDQSTSSSRIGAVTKSGTGTLRLSGQNTYTGATTVNAGSLFVNGSLASDSAVTVGASGTLGGSGTVNGTVALSGAIAPGDGIGTLNTGANTWDNTPEYVFEIEDADAGAGTGWDHLNITGALDITATGITIKLTSLDTNGNPGEAPDFQSGESYTWTIATASGGITGFDADNFTVNTDDFENACNGTFSVEQSGNDLRLCFVPTSAGTIIFFQ